MPFQQVDPKYFDFASRFMQGQQQAVDRNAQQSEISRRNALLAMEQQAATQQNTLFNQGQQDRTAEMEQKSLQRLLNAASNLEGVANDPNAFDAVKGQVFSNPELAPILQKYGLSPEMVTPQSVAQFNAQLRAAGSAAAPQPQDTGPLQEYVGPGGKPIFGTREQAVGQQAYHPPQAAPQPQPLVQFLDDSGNPVWGTREQALGKRPVPPQASLKDQLDADKITEAKSRVSGNLDALNEYYGELSNLGAAVDTGKEGLGNVSAAARASAIGQIGGRAFGTKEQSVRNKINQMRPLLLQEIRQASAMGARGLDSNKELDFYLQAATDPSRDLQANIAALNVLSNAYGLGKPYGEVSPEAVAKMNTAYLGSLPLVTTDAQYKALAVGSEYRDSSGKRWKKK